MQKPPKPADEDHRLEALRRLKVLDTGPEERFDRLTRLAQSLLGVPTALISLVDSERQWFKSRQGLDAKEYPRDVSFCGHAILAAEPFVVPDASKDPRFADNPQVSSAPNIRFYAGVPLRLSSGETMGTLCVTDRIPRTLDAKRLRLLRDLASLAANELEGATLDVALSSVREQEARYQALLDETTDLIVDVDPEGRVLFANKALLAALHYGPGEAAGLTLAALAGAGSGDVDAALPARTGETVLVRGRAFVPLEGGRPARARFVLQDVTARVRAEKRLAGRLAAAKARRRRGDKALRELRGAVEASAIAAETDADGRITSVNALFSELSGWPREELIGKTHRIVKSGVHPDAFFRQLWETISSGRAWRGEICNRSKGGALYWVSLAVTPVLGEDGKPSRYLSFGHDITERKLAEARAADSASRLQTILDGAVHVSIVTADATGIVTAFNAGAEKLLGFAAAEALGKPYALFHPGADPAAPDAFETREAAYARKDGAPAPVLLSMTALRGKQGEPAGFLAVAVDASSTRLARADLAKARDAALDLEKAKARFLSSMSRGIRGPANAVAAAAGLLLDAGPAPEQRELAETIRAAGESLHAILGDILDFSRLEAGAAPLEEHAFDPRLVVEDAAALFAGRAQDKGLELAAAVEDGVPAGLLGDAGRVRQVVCSFVANALEAAEAGEIVVGARLVGTEAGAARLRFEVRDTGRGLDAAALAKVFAYDGGGVGLPAAGRIAGLMKGSVGAESVPGKGSTFWLEAAFPIAAAAPPSDPPGLAGVRVLVVDGSETVRRVAARHAASWRMRPSAVPDGAAALAALRAAEAEGDPFILALIDHRMPDMDGTQLAQEIKGDPGLVAVRMILLSSLSACPEPDQLPGQGFDGALVKPLLRSALLEGVADALGARRSLTAAPSASFKGLRVLVAEDNPASRQAALHHLRSLGCRADAVATGVEAAAAVASIPYDVVLMDCRMPEMDGFEAAAAIRARPSFAGRKLSIVGMADDAAEGGRERCEAAGMDGCVSKPLRRAELAAALGRRS